jgi:uncharacterized protein
MQDFQSLYRSATPAMPWRFFALTFALSWAAWIAAAFTGQTSMQFPTVLLFVAGGCGPSIAGVYLIYRNTDRSARRDLWTSLLDFRRVSPAWAILCLLGTPATALAGIALNAALAGITPAYALLSIVAAQPLALLSFAGMALIAGPLSEELGWRGFALDRLVLRWGRGRAGLLLGVIWWAWHLPLFWLQGTTHNRMRIGTADFWLFLVNTMAMSVLITCAYTANHRSVLAAVLIHFSYNFMFTLLDPFQGPVWWFQSLFGLLLVAAVLLIVRLAPSVRMPPSAKAEEHGEQAARNATGAVIASD